MTETTAPAALAPAAKATAPTTALARRPTASPLIMHGTRFLARVFGMFGVPGLRLVPGLGDIDLIRGLQAVEDLAIDAESEARLAASLDGSRATFLTPNHPEVFTDWMVDWELVSRQSFRAAFWAGAEMVNGIFSPIWRRHNLIPTGQGGWGRRYSLELVADGKGVCLHPEGDVLWTRDEVHPCFPGVMEMAVQAARAERDRAQGKKVWVQPILYKSAFVEDVSRGLHLEMDQVERRLGLRSGWGLPVAERFAMLSVHLLTSRRQRWGLPFSTITPANFFEEQDLFLEQLLELAGAPTAEDRGTALVGERVRAGRFPSQTALRQRVRLARKRLKRSVDPSARELSAELKRLYGASSMVYRQDTLRPEHIAECLKRIKEQLFVGRLTDPLRLMMPSTVGRRVVQVKVPDPLRIGPDDDVTEAMERLHARMQDTLDAIDDELDRRTLPVRWPTPFAAPS